MLMLVALGIMSVTWMAVIAVLIVAQKLLPAIAAIDVPLALAIVGLGILIVMAPVGSRSRGADVRRQGWRAPSKQF
jgi:predicted metal-binding membrane protein